MKTITGTIALRAGGIEISSQLTVPVENTTLEGVLPALRVLTDDVVRAAEQGAPGPVTCSAGCDACCHQLVGISAVEATAISRLVDEIEEPRRSELRARFSSIADQLSQAGLLEDLRTRKGTPRELGLRYFKLHLACPFLEESKCSIYASRPLACREYLVTSDPVHCQTPTPATVKTIAMPAKMSTALLRCSGTDWVPLPLALEHRNAHQAPGGTGPELLRAILQEMNAT